MLLSEERYTGEGGEMLPSRRETLSSRGDALPSGGEMLPSGGYRESPLRRRDAGVE